MEIVVIGSLILSGIAIIALGAINVLLIKTHSNDRNQLEKLIKARDLREYEMFSPQEPEPVEEAAIEERYVPIEEIGNYLEKKE